MFLIFFSSTTQISFSESKIPEYIKSNAGWWAEGAIGDSDFVQGIQYLIKEGIMKIPPTTQGSSSGENKIPEYIKSNAGWWAEGAIDDDTFVQGIQYLIKEGIMAIDVTQQTEEDNSSENTNQESSVQTKATTVLVYIVGHNLERNYDNDVPDLMATHDIMEMVAGEPSEKINVIVATGGSEQATPEENSKRRIDFTKVQYFQITGSRVSLVEELGESSMSEQDRLSHFIEWGTQKFPAEKFVLILWGHGYATGGYGNDNTEKGQNKKLTLEELDGAFSQAKSKTKVDFELIGFDSCLMAAIEVADTIKDYAKYMVASEELEPGLGWDYKSIIEELNKDPTQEGDKLGKTIVKSFIKDVERFSKDDNSNAHLYSTLSVINLQEIDALDDAVSKLTNKVLALTGKTPELQQALNKAERFGQRSGIEAGQIDLRDFSNIIGEQIPELKVESDAIKSRMDAVVVYNEAGKSRPHSNGLSFNFPRTENVVSTDYSFGPTRGLVEYYSTYLKDDKTSPELSNLKMEQNRITGSYSGDDVYEINFYFTDEIDDDGILEVFSTDEYDAEEFPPGKIDFSWDGYEPSLCNSEFCYPINPEWEWGDADLAYLPVIVYDDLEKDGLRGDLIYDLTSEDEPIFIGFWPVGHDESVFQKNLLPLRNGDYVQIIATLEDWENGIDYYEPVERLKVDSEFGFSWKVFDWGPLDIWIEICDFSDNCDWWGEPFTIDSLDVADVKDWQIIPYEQNDPLNQDYEWGESYDLEFSYEYNYGESDVGEYDYGDYYGEYSDEDYEFDYGEFYDEYGDEEYEFDYNDDAECWIDDEGYGVCEMVECGLDFEGYEICDGEFFG